MMSSGFLFARPSAISGLARLTDFAGTFDEYNNSESPDAADAKAMYADWFMVGDSLRDALMRETADECEDELEQGKAA